MSHRSPTLQAAGVASTSVLKGGYGWCPIGSTTLKFYQDCAGCYADNVALGERVKRRWAVSRLLQNPRRKMVAWIRVIAVEEIKYRILNTFGMEC